MTNVPKLQLTKTGVSVPLESEVLAGVLADINQAFGGGLNTTSLETPQGQLASSQAAVVADKNNQLAELANQFDPKYADGIWQDALARIYFLTRKPATASVAECELIGLVGVVIPAGFFVQDTNGVLWSLQTEVTIPVGGKVTGTFACTESGAIAAPAGSINSVYRALTGLDRVNNLQDATIGSEQESRADFERRRAQSVAVNAHGTPAAVYGEVANLAGVSDLYVIDNVLKTVVTLGATNYSVDPSSIYVAVVGGDNTQIADAIWRKTGNGCSYNGNTTVKLYDNNYSNPKPEYTIKFMRPAALPVYFEVQVENDGNVPANIETLVRGAIKSAFAAGSDIRPRIGAHMHAIKFAPKIDAVIGDAHLLSVAIGKSASALGVSLGIGIDQYPTIADANIKITLV